MPEQTQTIAYEDYLKLLGLTALVNEHMAQINYLKRAVASIIDRDPEDYGDGVLDDWLWSLDSRNVHDLIRDARLEVEPPADEGKLTDG